jgi:hypothetical protein
MDEEEQVAAVESVRLEFQISRHNGFTKQASPPRLQIQLLVDEMTFTLEVLGLSGHKEENRQRFKQ